MTRLDWALVLPTLPYMAWVLLRGIFGIGLGADHAVAIVLTFSAVMWPLLIWWMATGGAASALWGWLPPFWPWGRILHSARGRWLFVSVMLAASIAGAVATLK